jgi:FkbM family methyltransferase
MALPLNRLTEKARALGYEGATGLVGFALLKFVAIPILNRWLTRTGARFQHYSPSRDRAIPIRKLSTKVLLDMKVEDESAHEWWETVRRLPIAGGVVVDVGANVGVTSIWLAGLARQVYAFEPSPDNAALMREQLALRRVTNVELFPGAVSDRSGSATLYVKTSAMTHSLARIGKTAPVGEVEVETITLDDFAARRGIDSIALLKIDTEGFEPEVVRGAKGLLAARRVRHILFEYSPAFYAERGLGPLDVLRQLSDLGYGIFSLDGAAVDAAGFAGDMAQRDLLARPN